MNSNNEMANQLRAEMLKDKTQPATIPGYPANEEFAFGTTVVTQEEVNLMRLMRRSNMDEPVLVHTADEADKVDAFMSGTSGQILDDVEAAAAVVADTVIAQNHALLGDRRSASQFARSDSSNYEDLKNDFAESIIDDIYGQDAEAVKSRFKKTRRQSKAKADNSDDEKFVFATMAVPQEKVDMMKEVRDDVAFGPTHTVDEVKKISTFINGGSEKILNDVEAVATLVADSMASMKNHLFEKTQTAPIDYQETKETVYRSTLDAIYNQDVEALQNEAKMFDEWAREDAQEIEEDKRTTNKAHKPQKLSWEEYAIQNPKRAERHRIGELHKASQESTKHSNKSSIQKEMVVGVNLFGALVLGMKEVLFPREVAQHIATNDNASKHAMERLKMLSNKLSKGEYLSQKASLFKSVATLVKATKMPQLIQGVMGVAHPQHMTKQPNAVRYAQTGTITSTQESVIITDAGAKKHNNVFSWIKGAFSHIVTTAFVSKKVQGFSDQIKKEVKKQALENTPAYQARAEYRKQVRAEKKRAELASKKAKAARRAQRLAQDSQEYVNRTAVKPTAPVRKVSRSMKDKVNATLNEGIQR